jgi:hypothetical protein
VSSRNPTPKAATVRNPGIAGYGRGPGHPRPGRRPARPPRPRGAPVRETPSGTRNQAGCQLGQHAHEHVRNPGAPVRETPSGHPHSSRRSARASTPMSASGSTRAGSSTTRASWPPSPPAVVRPPARRSFGGADSGAAIARDTWAQGWAHPQRQRRRRPGGIEPPSGVCGSVQAHPCLCVHACVRCRGDLPSAAVTPKPALRQEQTIDLDPCGKAREPHPVGPDPSGLAKPAS